MAANDGNNVEFGGEIPQCRQGAEFDDSGLHRLSATFMETTEEIFGGAQMHENNGPRLN